MKWNFAAWTLLPRVLIQALPIAIIALLATWYFTERAIRETVGQEIHQRLQNEATQRASKIAYQLTTLRSAARALAQNDLIINALIDEDTRASYLPTFFRSYVAPGPAGAKVSLLDYKGRFIASNDTHGNYTSAPWLNRVMAGGRAFSIDANGLLIAEPVHHDGAPEGIIVLRYDLASLALLVNTTGSAPVTMFDRDNALLYAWKHDDLATTPSALLEDKQWLYSTVALPEHDEIRVVSFARRDQSAEVLSSIRLAAKLNVGASLIAVLGGIGWAAYLAVRPVSTMSEELRSMGYTADLSKRLSSTGSAEVRILTQTFNSLLSRLEDSMTSRESLEVEVRERTLAEATLRTKAQELQTLTDDLQRSNHDLERFAYIASHDLQEPLRMVGSYTQLLQRRYSGQLDESADEYINFAVDGAKRMQALLNDLLQYSRVGSSGKQLQPTDTATVAAAARDNLLRIIEDSAASVTIADQLPQVLGDTVQLTQLLQNLIANAIKFRGAAAPQVSISASRLDDSTWRFAVADNGIGICAEYHERIFEVFQRLHGVAQYAGTGIGLAVCKRVVQNHGGEIWAESKPGDGATFYFTLKGVASGRDTVASVEAA
ncbi:MAG: signal transduction histidine kinase [Gammaproteobacteria bacterium]|jgi:signal transduction histidine kinase